MGHSTYALGIRKILLGFSVRLQLVPFVADIDPLVLHYLLGRGGDKRYWGTELLDPLPVPPMQPPPGPPGALSFKSS